MAEEVQAFFRADGPQDRADSSPKTWNCSLSALRRSALSLLKTCSIGLRSGEYAGRKNAVASAASIASITPATFVSRKVIHDDNVAATERWSQTLFDIGEKYLSVDRAINHEGCHYSVMAQAGYQGDRLPMPVRNGADQSFTAVATAPQPHHLGAGASFIDEHQPGRIKHELLSPPAAARAGHVRPLLFRGMQAFFQR